MKMTNSHDSERPIALITGGSKGIGFELAKQFAQHGYDLVLVARHRNELERAASELQTDYRSVVTTISLDLIRDDAPAELVRELQTRDINIDVLVNNAGIGNYGPFTENDPARLSAMLRLNILSLTVLTRQLLPDMIAKGRGRVLNLSSVVAFFAGGSHWTSYVASKHYVLAFTRGLRRELTGTGVTVTALCPGPTDTDFIDQSGVGGSRIYRWIPKVSPAGVARAGYRAAMAGKTVVVPGLLNKLFAFLGELPPRGIAQSVFFLLLREKGSVKTKRGDDVMNSGELSFSHVILVAVAGLFGMAGCSSSPAVDAATPRFVVDAELFPYSSRYLELNNGALIHYVDEGEGPVLLLLHGNPTWSFLYRHLIADLKKDFRVIVPDYPGFGLSTAPLGYGYTAAEQAIVLAEFVENLELRGVTLMVQDWGGPIGFAVAERHPERIDGFVIGNTWAWPLERTGHKVFSTLMGGWPGQFAAWCCNGVVHFFLSQGMERVLTDAELSMYLAPFAERSRRMPTHLFPAQLWDADAFLQSVHDGLPGLSDRPALVVWGVEDFAFQEPERSRFETLFPNHHTVLLENAGHFIQEDAPQEIAAAIRDWHPAVSVK